MFFVAALLERQAREKGEDRLLASDKEGGGRQTKEKSNDDVVFSQ